MSLVAFALSLLAKTSGMVLPAVLLLLDVYPLRRLARDEGGKRPWRARITEKAPWIVFGLLAAWFAWIGQLRSGGAVSALAEVGLADRAAIAGYGFLFYPLKTLLPSGLSPLYPLGEAPTLDSVRAIAGLIGLVVITGGALALRRRLPALLTAWAAYLVIILPVVGIAHVGVQFAGDRYSYLATMPLVALVAGGVLLGLESARRRPLTIAATLVLLLLAALSWRQTGVWRDSVTLWTRVAEQFPASHVGHHRLGAALVAAQRPAEAITPFTHAIELAPEADDANARYELAEARFARGEIDAALDDAARVLAARATHLGALLLSEQIHVRLARPAEALAIYRAALVADPDFVPARVRISHLLRTQLDDLPGAVAEAERAVTLAPRSDAAHAVLGLALLDAGEKERAAHHLRIALETDPGNPDLRAALAATR